MTNSRYISVKNHRGIRKDTKTGKFQARKKVEGRTYTETFIKVSEAIKWRESFHPSRLSLSLGQSSQMSQGFMNDSAPILNGRIRKYSFKNVWDMYCSQYLPSIEIQSARDTVRRASNLFPEFYNFNMTQITAELIDDVIVKKVQQYKVLKNTKGRRSSYRNELKTLKAILNWYRENYDVMFVVPVLKRHFVAGVIKKEVNGLKPKMTPEQSVRFFNSLDIGIWGDFAKFHFYMAGRAQEPAGIQWSSIDLENRRVIVSDVAVWGNNKQFEYLKEVPKNGQERIVHLNEDMLEILDRRLHEKQKSINFKRPSNSTELSFVFHIDGEPLSYRQLQYRYNKALKKADLFPQFSATHILRKAMANIVRQSMGLDAAQAVGGWKSREVVEKVYTDSMPTELNKSAVENVQTILRKTVLN